VSNKALWKTVAIVGAIIVVFGAVVAYVLTNGPQQATPASKAADDSLRNDMSVTVSYSLAALNMQVRTALIGYESEGKSTANLTKSNLASNPKLKLAIEQYDQVYSQFVRHCIEVYRDLGECVEREDQPGAVVINITRAEFANLKALMHLGPVQDQQPFRLGPIGKSQATWVSYNGTQYSVKVYSEWDKISP